MMKVKAYLLPVIASLALGAAQAARAEDFFIRIELLRGVSGRQEFAPADPAVAIYPILNFVHSGHAGADPIRPSPPVLNEDLVRIYNLNTVYGLAEGTLRWNDKTDWLPGVFMVDRETFRLDLEPKSLPPKRMKLRLLVSRIRNKAGDLERVLDTDLVVSMDDPVVVGFTSGRLPYFLSLKVTKTEPVAEAPAGGPRPEKPIAPIPVRQVAPKIPENVDSARLEGEVVLRVTVDAGGKVSDVQVLRSLQPDVDRETVRAIREWTFAPVRDEAGTRPTTFAMSFRYRTVPWESIGGPESGPADEPLDAPKAAGLEQAASEPAELERILAFIAEYCRRLSGAALDFVCEERIAEEIYDYVPTIDPNSDVLAATALKRLAKKNKLVYDFQMVKTAEGIRESRTLLEDNGRKTRQPNAPLLTKRFFSYRSLYAPVGLFSREQWPFFDYRIIGQDKIRGRKAWVIEAKPKPGGRPEVTFGKAWVTQDSHQIIKIEVDQASLAGYEKALAEYDLSQLKPVFTTTHLYEVEKNGIMFPSQTVFKESFTVLSTQRRIQRSKAEILFADYRFFTVETETAIKD